MGRKTLTQSVNVKSCANGYVAVMMPCVVVVITPCVGYGGRDDYDRGYGGRGYDRDYDDRDRYLSRRGWDDGTCPHCPNVLSCFDSCFTLSDHLCTSSDVLQLFDTVSYVTEMVHGL